MGLSNQTYQNLANALKDEVVDFIFESDAYFDFMRETIPEAIQAKLGPVDDEVLFELSMCLMDKIYLKADK